MEERRRLQALLVPHQRRGLCDEPRAWPLTPLPLPLPCSALGSCCSWFLAVSGSGKLVQPPGGATPHIGVIGTVVVPPPSASCTCVACAASPQGSRAAQTRPPCPALEPVRCLL